MFAPFKGPLTDLSKGITSVSKDVKGIMYIPSKEGLKLDKEHKGC